MAIILATSLLYIRFQFIYKICAYIYLAGSESREGILPYFFIFQLCIRIDINKKLALSLSNHIMAIIIVIVISFHE